MDLRLDFSLPEMLRISWVSDAARALWEPRIQAISNAWQIIERLAVFHGAKPAALQTCAPENLPELSRWAASRNRLCIPLSQQGAGGGYQNATMPYELGKPWSYRVIIATRVEAEEFANHWFNGQDNEYIGQALGYPPCCRNFFHYQWGVHGWRDLTWPMAQGDGTDEFYHKVSGPVECNILLRWLGLRLVGHLPCRFNCDPTTVIGKEIQSVGRASGYDREMDWLTHILNWPIRWSSLHGVAIITTPVFKLIVDSTAVSQKLVVDRDGPEYPEEGAKGVEFPLKTIHTMQLRNDWTDNGFSSKEAMDNAHATIVDAVRVALGSEKGVDIGKVIDLGCGNGALLEEIVHAAPWIIPCGVEIVVSRYQRAQRRLMHYNPELHCGNIFDETYWNPPYSLALIAVQRLLEANEANLDGLLERLRNGCNRLIVYSYDTSVELRQYPKLLSSRFSFIIRHTDQNAIVYLLEPRRSHGKDNAEETTARSSSNLASEAGLRPQWHGSSGDADGDDTSSGPVSGNAAASLPAGEDIARKDSHKR